MIPRRMLLAGFVLAPFSVAAHEPQRGPNGGQKADIGSNHAELVAAGNTLRLFLFDGADRPVPAAGVTAQVVVLAAGRQTTVVLAPTGDNELGGTGDFTAARGMRAVVTLILPGQRPAQARFTPMDQN
ncbi:MAG: hypothetical protein JWO26_817 [Rhodospirillales bacterium]|jgi:hypothetical protein|nr:hypothetical protein [Rhodospirillales bacterium]MDB5381185.1 hypothetical protein [Rhodospirillales bacterium]